VLLFLVSLPAVTTRLYSSDEVQYFSYLRSLYFDQDVSFENEYRYFHDRNIAQSAGFHETFLERETAAGRRVNYGTLGAALLWSPFYAAADAWTRVSGSHEANGFTLPYVRAVAYGSAFYGFLAILLSARAARYISHRKHTENTQGKPGQTSPGSSSASSSAAFSSVFLLWPGFLLRPVFLLWPVAVWLGTPLLFYMYVAPPFSHACSAFAVALFVNVWLHVRQTWSPGGAFALGLCAALLAMVREQDVFMALGPAIDFCWASRTAFINARGAPPPRALARGRRSAALLSGRSLGPQARLSMQTTATGLAGVFGTVLGYSPQLFAYNALNGYPGPAEHVARKMYWYSPHALQVLASPHHGLFFWTPLAVLALIGLFFVRERIVMVCLAVMVASQVYVAGSVESWTVAGAFGQRRFVCITVILVIGLSALFQAARGKTRTVACALVAICVWWNVALMAQFATRLMDRQRLELPRNAYHAFVTLPISAPSLVYRYLTDRASFYESQPGTR
jgi:hypothetical protein